MVIYKAFEIPKDQVIRIWVESAGKWVHGFYLGWDEFQDKAMFLLTESEYMNQKALAWFEDDSDVYGNIWRFSEDEEKKVFERLTTELNWFQQRAVERDNS